MSKLIKQVDNQYSVVKDTPLVESHYDFLDALRYVFLSRKEYGTSPYPRGVRPPR